ncbi:unnamed protein product [Spirodela intermedia]|uniref:Uncharacterized protein n=1 Tax=Spirodela intermedia TaxID=51605 RepID=A0A7I8KK56_SPIIN|nr:unnamed protein product [Spirodela intermedia]
MVSYALIIIEETLDPNEPSKFSNAISREDADKVLFIWIKDQMYHKKITHIDVKYHFIHDIIFSSEISLQKIGTKDKPTDMLIKPLLISKFQHCLDLIRVHTT